MDQVALPFFDSAESATKHAIAASGKEPKQVAAWLWPEKSVARAATDLLNALNENRAERLTTDQHILIANRLGRFEWLHYAAHQCNHSQPEPVAPLDALTQLQREFMASVEKLTLIQKRIEVAQARVPNGS